MDENEVGGGVGALMGLVLGFKLVLEETYVFYSMNEFDTRIRRGSRVRGLNVKVIVLFPCERERDCERERQCKDEEVLFEWKFGHAVL